MPFVRQRARLDAGENALHFIDLLALRFYDFVAEPLDLANADLRLSATFSNGYALTRGMIVTLPLADLRSFLGQSRAKPLIVKALWAEPIHPL